MWEIWVQIMIPLETSLFFRTDYVTSLNLSIISEAWEVSRRLFRLYKKRVAWPQKIIWEVAIIFLSSSRGTET